MSSSTQTQCHAFFLTFKTREGGGGGGVGLKNLRGVQGE